MIDGNGPPLVLKLLILFAVMMAVGGAWLVLNIKTFEQAMFFIAVNAMSFTLGWMVGVKSAEKECGDNDRSE